MHTESDVPQQTIIINFIHVVHLRIKLELWRLVIKITTYVMMVVVLKIIYPCNISRMKNMNNHDTTELTINSLECISEGSFSHINGAI